MGTQLPPEKRAQPPTQFLAHIYCGQMAGWIKMPLGMEVNLGKGDTVSVGRSSPPPKRGTAPSFRPMCIVAKQLDGTEVHLGPGHIVLGGDPAPLPNPCERGTAASSFQPMSILATVVDLSYC